LHGQNRLEIRDADGLKAACEDVAERLRGDGQGLVQVHCLADAKGRPLCCAALSGAEIEFPGRPAWQIMAWEWLAARFGWGEASPWDSELQLKNQLMPWLFSAEEAAERQRMYQTLAREHASEMERLAAERDALERENRRLSERNAALQQVDAERLVTFLPALYAHVFTVLGAADLALLCGRVEPLPIPNPYPEPSDETLHTLQKGFRALPRALQKQIVGFVARLPQRQKLQPRPEMRELVRELEQN
ncbi:MAG: hypothetical protein K6346_05315, partial [Halothiobacillaceae bacterium]